MPMPANEVKETIAYERKQARLAAEKHGMERDELLTPIRRRTSSRYGLPAKAEDGKEE